VELFACQVFGSKKKRKAANGKNEKEEQERKAAKVSEPKINEAPVLVHGINDRPKDIWFEGHPFRPHDFRQND